MQLKMPVAIVCNFMILFCFHRDLKDFVVLLQIKIYQSKVGPPNASLLPAALLYGRSRLQLVALFGLFG